MTDPVVGLVLEGRYRLEERLARGGMSTVYSATDLRLHRTVAVKVMAEHLAHDPAFVDRFTREARATAMLSHVNVVSVSDQGSDQGWSSWSWSWCAGARCATCCRPAAG